MSFPPDTSKLDLRQIFQGVYDEENRQLRVNATATIENPSLSVELDPSEDGVYIADKDTGAKVKVNTDGSINVNIVSEVPELNVNVFDEQLAVASGSTTDLVTYIVPIGKIALLERIHVSGENIAKYEVFVNAEKIDASRTYFGSALNVTFNYLSETVGYILSPADIVTVTVLHNRPSVGDFEGRIQITEIG